MEDLLNSFLHKASGEMFPTEYADTVLDPGEGVQLCSQFSRGDYHCRAPRTVFHRLRRGKRGVVHYDTTSEFGLVRTWCFTDAPALARALLEHLPKEVGTVVADVRTTDEGTLAITTRMHLAWQRERGMLHCPDCGYFFAGERGLKDHQLMKHRKVFFDAQEVIAQNRSQVVLYKPPPNFLSAEVYALREGELFRQKAARIVPDLEPGLEAARNGNLSALKELIIDTEWDVYTARDAHGSNALLWAAGGGHLDTCCYLVDDCGLDAHWVQKKDKRSALHWAARNGHLSVCRWLVVENGANPNSPTVDGTVPLHWAAWQGHEDVCDWLVVEAGADLHAVNNYGCNASQWAALAGNTRMCTWLHNAGLDLKLLNYNGHSALHKAAIKGQQQVCEWLIVEAGLGAAQMQPDSDGNTPAYMAQCEGHTKLAIWLQKQVVATAAAPAADGLSTHAKNDRVLEIGQEQIRETRRTDEKGTTD